MRRVGGEAHVRHAGEDELNVAVVTALARTVHGLRQHLQPLFAAAGLTAGQFEALKALHEHGPLCINDLLQATLSTSGNIDVILDNLLAKQMISKAADPADRRKRVVALTDRGRAYIESRFPAHVEELRHSMSVLSFAERRQLQRLLARLVDSL